MLCVQSSYTFELQESNTGKDQIKADINYALQRLFLG